MNKLLTTTDEYEELSTEQPVWRQILRWIAVLPGAIIGSFLAGLLFRFWFWPDYGIESSVITTIREIIGGLIEGSVFICCAGYIAPRGKLPTVITLTAIWLLMNIFVLVDWVIINDFRPYLGFPDLDAWRPVFDSIALSVGSIIGCMVIYNDVKNL